MPDSHNAVDKVAHRLDRGLPSAGLKLSGAIASSMMTLWPPAGLPEAGSLSFWGHADRAAAGARRLFSHGWGICAAGSRAHGRRPEAYARHLSRQLAPGPNVCLCAT
jgi:hypothetical protein